MSDTVRIGILGDCNAGLCSHHATNEALQQASHPAEPGGKKRMDPDALPGQA